MVKLAELEAVQEKLRRLVQQKDEIEEEITRCLQQQTQIALGKQRDPGTSQERQPRDVVPARMFELAKTLKEKLILALGPSDDGYMSIDEVSTLIREPVDRVQSGLRDLRAKYRLLEAPENNTWRLNDKGRAEYERLTVPYSS